MGYIKHLVDTNLNNIEEEGYIYPVSVTNAIYNNSNVSLDTLLSNINNSLSDHGSRISDLEEDITTKQDTLLQYVTDASYDSVTNQLTLSRLTGGSITVPVGGGGSGSGSCSLHLGYYVASSGKFYTTSAHTTEIAKVSTDIYFDVTNDPVIDTYIVKNNTYCKASGGGSSVTVDTSLNTSSSNPVQNSAIATAINTLNSQLSGKQATLVGGTNIKNIVVNGTTYNLTNNPTIPIDITSGGGSSEGLEYFYVGVGGSARKIANDSSGYTSMGFINGTNNGDVAFSWNSSSYVNIKASVVGLGSMAYANTGSYLTSTEIVNSYVPYTGASQNVNLNNHNLSNVATLSATAVSSTTLNNTGNASLGTDTTNVHSIHGKINTDEIKATGNIIADGGISGLKSVTVSDKRLKYNLKDVNLKIEEIADAPAVKFSWASINDMDAGTIAQYWLDVLPEVVNKTNGYYSLEYGNLAVICSIKLARKVVELESRITELENAILK